MSILYEKKSKIIARFRIAVTNPHRLVLDFFLMSEVGYNLVLGVYFIPKTEIVKVDFGQFKGGIRFYVQSS